MNILLIGATGGTGRLILPLLLAAGHKVTALVRRPEAVPTRHDRLVVVAGNVRDQDALGRAVEGQDAVISTLGPRALGKDDLQEVYMRNLVAGMTRHGVKRLVNLSAWGSLDTHPRMNLMQDFFKKVVLRHIYADKKRGQQILFASDLDYVNACPGMLLNRPARGGIRASADGAGIRHSMTRADLAQWMVDQLTSNTWLRQSPLVG